MTKCCIVRNPYNIIFLLQEKSAYFITQITLFVIMKSSESLNKIFFSSLDFDIHTTSSPFSGKRVMYPSTSAFMVCSMSFNIFFFSSAIFLLTNGIFFTNRKNSFFVLLVKAILKSNKQNYLFRH